MKFKKEVRGPRAILANGCSRLGICVLAVLTLGIASSSRAQTFVEAWGYGNDGELGNGTTASSDVPVVVSGITNGVTAIAGGTSDTLAIQKGVAYTWGDNIGGELGDGSAATRSPVPVVVNDLSSVTAIASGSFHSMAIQSGGVYAWGEDTYDQLGNPSVSNNSSVPVPVSGLSSGVTAIAAGYAHSFAIQNGGVYAWGLNNYGQLGNASTTNSSVPVAVSGFSSGVTAVAGGVYHSLAIRNGSVYAWGDNTEGELGNNSITRSTVPVAVSGLSSDVTAIAGGDEFSLALKSGGVYAWGDNYYGQLGDGTTANHLTPEQIDPAALNNIIAIAVGSEGNSSYALASDGSIWDWGYNGYGDLGLGNTSVYDVTPQHLLPPTGYIFTAISANRNGAVALLAQVPEPASLSFTTLVGVVLLARQRGKSNNRG